MDPDLIELQLAHAERNEIRAAYNRTQLLPQQGTMMQAWTDYLDKLRDGSSVVNSLTGPREVGRSDISPNEASSSTLR